LIQLFPGKLKSSFHAFSNDEEALINKELPKELLLRIFSFLDIITLCRCAQVSKAWHILALDGSNWQRIDLFNFQTDVEGRVLENISKRCGGFLRQLSLRGCLGVGDSSLKTFAQNCRNIEHLILNGCTKITDSTCYSIGKCCSRLKHLDLTSCVFITNNSLKIDEALHHIENHCHQLVILNLQSCTQISDDGVVGICRGCHQLQSLCVSGCTNLTDVSLIALGLNYNTLVQLSIHCPKLQALSLSHCEHITDDGILHLSSSTCGHERLQVLELDNCLLITDVALEHLENCHNLERIELYDCQQVSRAGIKRIKAHLPDVKVHAYFAPVTPTPSVGSTRPHLCRCCIIL
uniref:F-box and leucine rich repeat protein 2 n=1 Tax=Anolis carolinensis TaxID=28377 RepID=H9GK54_ANOCA